MVEHNCWVRFRAWLAYLIFPDPNTWYIEAVEMANKLEAELAELTSEHERLIRRANELEESQRAYSNILEGKDET